MRLLLRSDVQGVGRRGDEVDVAPGFARNYLLPTGRAIVSTPGMQSQAAAMRRARDLRYAADRSAAETVAGVIAGAAIAIPVRAGAQGRLFGSVTSSDIAEAILAQTGANVDRRKVLLDEPIKTLGTHPVQVRLHPEVETTVTIELVPES